MLDKFSVIRKKWYIILICALIGSLSLYIEKSVTRIVPVVGKLIYGDMIQLDKRYPEYINGGNIEVFPDMEKMNNLWIIQNEFMDKISNKYDFSLLGVKWDKLDNQQKIDWINKHFFVYNLGNGTYFVELQFLSQDAYNFDYVEKIQSKLLADYVESMQTTLALEVQDPQFKIVDFKRFIVKSKEDDVSTIRAKYAVVGFILGAVVGTAVILVVASKKHD